MRILKALGVIALLAIIQLTLCKLAVSIGDFRTEPTQRGQLRPEQIRTWLQELRQNSQPSPIENDSPMEFPSRTLLADPASGIVKIQAGFAK